MDVSSDLRKLIMAGIGAASVAAEKSQETIENLAKRGEEAVEQGKVLNEQLRHEIKNVVKDNITVVEQKPADKDSILAALETLTPEERAEIKKHIGKLDPKKTDEAKADGK